MLYVKIISLVDFVKDGWSQRNDLFIILKYKDQKRQTTIKWNDLNPVWNEAFIFDYEGMDTLNIKIYDSNIFDKDIVLTEENIPVFMGKIQEFNIAKIKLEMGNPLVGGEMENKIDNLEKINLEIKNKNIDLEQKLEKIKYILKED